MYATFESPLKHRGFERSHFVSLLRLVKIRVVAIVRATLYFCLQNYVKIVLFVYHYLRHIDM